MSDYKCPECGHTEFYCQGTISASLSASFDGELDYQLREWEDILEIGGMLPLISTILYESKIT